MEKRNDELTNLIKTPNMIFMAMLRRLKLPHNEITGGVMIPAWLDESIKQYYKNKNEGGEYYGGIRLDEYLQKMFCETQGAYGTGAGAYGTQTGKEASQDPGTTTGGGSDNSNAQGVVGCFRSCHE